LNRRAAKYIKLIFTTKVKLTRFGFELDLKKHDKLGYFNCSEEVFNTMWEIGKYTLHINKHEEYESCPRNEMKYFTGDGIIDALVDAYAFGDGALTISSLSYTEISSNLGLRPDPFMRNVGLWEYPAWRIIHAYNHYLYFNDTYLLKQHFDELTSCLIWMIGKMNANDLIYQYPVLGGAFARDSASVDYTQAKDRLGEKPLNNALLYRSLVCMAEMAEIVGDARTDEWKALAQRVKNAINARLWSDEFGAYLDTYEPTYVPQDGNALCVLFGIADEERAKTVLKTLEATTWTPYGSTVSSKLDPHPFAGNDTVSPLMNTYESEARFLSGDGDGGIEILRRCFGGMIAKGATSFWEYCPATDSPKPKNFTSCHAWSTGCTYILGAYVLGIRPERAGYEVVRFEPYCGFDHFEGVVPTDKGPVAVRCETENGTKKFTVALPKNTILKTVLPENATIDIIEY
jgi:alpha-L-rhamnosidase